MFCYAWTPGATTFSTLCKGCSFTDHSVFKKNSCLNFIFLQVCAVMLKVFQVEHMQINSIVVNSNSVSLTKPTAEEVLKILESYMEM